MAFTDPPQFRVGRKVNAADLNDYLKANYEALKALADRLGAQNVQACATPTGGTNSSGKRMIVIIGATRTAGGSGTWDWYHESYGAVGGEQVTYYKFAVPAGDGSVVQHVLLVKPGASWTCTGGVVAVEGTI